MDGPKRLTASTTMVLSSPKTRSYLVSPILRVIGFLPSHHAESLSSPVTNIPVGKGIFW